jgi:carboxyl-terminal processing protease
MTQRRSIWLAAGLLGAGLAAGTLLLRRAAQPEAPLRPTRLFEQVFSQVRRFGVDSLSESELYRRAADGLLGQLDDEYATLLPAGSDLGLAERPDVGGLGMLLATRDARVSVLSVLPGSPADLAGVSAGDQLLEAGGTPLDPERRDQVLAALDGAPGTTLDIRVRRPGLGILSFKLVRGQAQAEVVSRGIKLDDRVGYIAVRLLGPGAARAARREVEELSRQGMGALVLDLRGASQGSLEEAVLLAEYLLDPGAGVVEVRGRGPEPRRVGDDSPQDRRVAALPVIALVDSGTADAGEVVAGALQDNDRALLLGEPTFGRGLTPETFPLADRMTIRMSTGRWYTPSGRPIQRDTATSDTVTSRSEVTTVGGRKVYSGGSIVPDSILHRATLSAGQLAFVRAIGADWSKWRHTIRAVAATLAARHPAGQEPIIGAPERAALYAALEKDGVSIPADIWQGGTELVDRALGNEIVRAAEGLEALTERRVRRDKLVVKAAELLRGATTPTSLVLGR